MLRSDETTEHPVGAAARIITGLTGGYFGNFSAGLGASEAIREGLAKLAQKADL